MGMLSRAMKNRKKAMQEELELEERLQSSTAVAVTKVVSMPDELAVLLSEMAQMQGTTVETIVTTRMMAFANAYKNSKVLRLHDTMPYGQYRGVLIEDMIRTDPRYTNWLASTSDIFVLDEEATAVLKELS